MKKVFVSYCHEDEAWKDRVVSHLVALAADEQQVDVWDDRRIAGGDDWLPEIEQAIRSCDLALLLISVDFLNSKFILREEVPRLLVRRAEEGVRVIPVILRDCTWTRVSWLKGIQARPMDGKSFASMTKPKAEAALTALAEEVADLLKLASPASISASRSDQRSAPLSPAADPTSAKALDSILSMAQQTPPILQDLELNPATDRIAPRPMPIADAAGLAWIPTAGHGPNI